MRKASATIQDALGAGFADLLHDLFAVGLRSDRPSMPVSRPRSAFWKLSWKVRPMAITSPTDFICVVRRESAAGNFSNAKRGIFVTT